MSRYRRLLVGALAAAVLASAAPATATDESTPAVLGGTNLLGSPATASGLVVVPEEASLALPTKGPNRDVKVSGGGRVAAVALVETGRREGRTFSLISGVVRACGEPGCHDRSTHFTVATRFRDGRVAIPPGVYRMYVVSDGAPVRAEVRLRGLSGRVRVPLPDETRVRVGSPETRVSSGSAGNVYSAGQTDDFPSGGIVFSALWLGGVPGVQADAGTCVYEGGPPVPEAAAYHGGCYALGARGLRFAAVAAATRFEVRLLSLTRPLRAGRWGHGLYYECACAATLHDALSIWVES